MTDVDLIRARLAVMSFLKAWREWEAGAASLAFTQRGSAGRRADEIAAGYQALLDRHWTPEAAAKPRGAVVHDPPQADPDRTSIIETAVRRGRIIVTTEEDVEPFGRATFEYVLERVGEDLRLADRRLSTPEGGLIKQVF